MLKDDFIMLKKLTEHFDDHKKVTSSSAFLDLNNTQFAAAVTTASTPIRPVGHMSPLRKKFGVIVEPTLTKFEFGTSRVFDELKLEVSI